MTVFLSSSISRSKAVLPISRDIARFIEEFGHEVVNKSMISVEYSQDPNWDKKIDAEVLYQRELERMLSADTLITECTTPSFGGGFFIDKCVEVKKPLLSLHYGYFPEDAPLMLRGRQDINLQMYTEDTIKLVLESYFHTTSQHE